MIVGEAESFTEVKQAVEVARRFGEDAAVADLREAKQRLRDACKELVSAVIKSDDIELISFQAESVEEMLEWIQLTSVSDTKLSSPVLLSTIHGAKGLEFDEVGLVHVNEGVLPWFDSNEAEERNLMYVAMTRAKTKFTGIVCGKFVQPSKFCNDVESFRKSLKLGKYDRRSYLVT